MRRLAELQHFTIDSSNDIDISSNGESHCWNIGSIHDNCLESKGGTMDPYRHANEESLDHRITKRATESSKKKADGRRVKKKENNVEKRRKRQNHEPSDNEPAQKVRKSTISSHLPTPTPRVLRKDSAGTFTGDSINTFESVKMPEKNPPAPNNLVSRLNIENINKAGTKSRRVKTTLELMADLTEKSSLSFSLNAKGIVSIENPTNTGSKFPEKESASIEQQYSCNNAKFTSSFKRSRSSPKNGNITSIERNKHHINTGSTFSGKESFAIEQQNACNNAKFTSFKHSRSSSKNENITSIENNEHNTNESSKLPEKESYVVEQQSCNNAKFASSFKHSPSSSISGNMTFKLTKVNTPQPSIQEHLLNNRIPCSSSSEHGVSDTNVKSNRCLSDKPSNPTIRKSKVTEKTSFSGLRFENGRNSGMAKLDAQPHETAPKASVITTNVPLTDTVNAECDGCGTIDLCEIHPNIDSSPEEDTDIQQSSSFATSPAEGHNDDLQRQDSIYGNYIDGILHSWEECYDVEVGPGEKMRILPYVIIH